MAEDLHKDNIEDFFKDAFDEQSDLPAADGWDVPSEQVWEKVEEAIHPVDGTDKGIIWWKYGGIGVLALILMIAGVFYFSSNKKEKGEQEITPVEDRVLNQKSDKGLTNPSLVEQNTSKKQSIDSENENLNSNKEPIIKKEDKNSAASLNNDKKESLEKSPKAENAKPKESTSNAKKELLAPNDLTDKAAIPLEKNNPLKNNPEKGDKGISPNKGKESQTAPSKPATKQKDIANTLENKKSSSPSDLIRGKDKKISAANNKDSTNANSVIAFEVLEPIPTKGLLAEVQSTSPDTLPLLQTPFTDLENKPEDTKSSRGFYAGISFAPTYTDRQIKITGNPVIPRGLKKNEMGHLSYSVGLNLGYKLSNNWSIESGFNYSRLILQHNGRKQVRYSAIGEQMNNRGEFEREYNFDLGTSSGDVNTDIALARDSDSPVVENEFITLQIKAKQNIQYGSIPLIARYQLGKGKLQVGLKAGLVNRFVLDGTFRIEEITIARNDFRLVLNDRVYRSRPLKKIKKYQADFLVGAGISYHFNKKMWLSVEPTFTRSINPLYETQLFKTYPVVTSLDIGFNFLF
ncbi:MAG: opacity protein-like surface antigen [Saprospiraceae bacterium]|jgi:opacity protein-like surface antigen